MPAAGIAENEILEQAIAGTQWLPCASHVKSYNVLHTAGKDLTAADTLLQASAAPSGIDSMESKN